MNHFKDWHLFTSNEKVQWIISNSPIVGALWSECNGYLCNLIGVCAYGNESDDNDENSDGNDEDHDGAGRDSSNMRFDPNSNGNVDPNPNGNVDPNPNGNIDPNSNAIEIDSDNNDGDDDGDDDEKKKDRKNDEEKEESKDKKDGKDGGKRRSKDRRRKKGKDKNKDKEKDKEEKDKAKDKDKAPKEKAKKKVKKKAKKKKARLEGLSEPSQRAAQQLIDEGDKVLKILENLSSYHQATGRFNFIEADAILAFAKIIEKRVLDPLSEDVEQYKEFYARERAELIETFEKLHIHCATNYNGALMEENINIGHVSNDNHQLKPKPRRKEKAGIDDDADDVIRLGLRDSDNDNNDNDNDNNNNHNNNENNSRENLRKLKQYTLNLSRDYQGAYVDKISCDTQLHYRATIWGDTVIITLPVGVEALESATKLFEHLQVQDDSKDDNDNMNMNPVDMGLRQREFEIEMLCGLWRCTRLAVSLVLVPIGWIQQISKLDAQFDHDEKNNIDKQKRGKPKKKSRKKKAKEQINLTKFKRYLSSGHCTGRVKDLLTTSKGTETLLTRANSRWKPGSGLHADDTDDEEEEEEEDDDVDDA